MQTSRSCRPRIETGSSFGPLKDAGNYARNKCKYKLKDKSEKCRSMNLNLHFTFNVDSYLTFIFCFLLGLNLKTALGSRATSRNQAIDAGYNLRIYSYIAGCWNQC
jgi:hypothetical protein